MGLMQGKVMGTTLVIMDSFALPVQGTETRVNAANEANEYMVQYIEGSSQVRRILFCRDLLSISFPRYPDWRMPWDGIIRIRVTDVGCLVLMSTPS